MRQKGNSPLWHAKLTCLVCNASVLELPGVPDEQKFAVERDVKQKGLQATMVGQKCKHGCVWNMKLDWTRQE